MDTRQFLPAIRDQIERVERDAAARPHDAAAAGALAMTLHAYQLYDPAASAYERARQLEPGSFDWTYLLGVVRMEQGDFSGAVASLRAALQLRPGDLPVQLRLGRNFAALGRHDEARSLFLELVKEHGDLPQAWYGLGLAQAAKGEHGAAAESLAKACELFPSYSAAHFALAGELRRLGNGAAAAQHTAAYTRQPNTEPPLADPAMRRVQDLNRSAQVHLRRGADLAAAGKIAEAIREHEAALAIDPGYVQAHVNLISLYGRAGEPDKAKQQFEAATALAPARSDAWYDYGVLLYQEQNRAEAERAFRRAIELNPHHAEGHNNLGSLLELQGRLDEAAAEFRAAIANRPNYPLARFHLARILVNQEKYDEAIQQLQKALEPEDEQTPLYLYALGAAYARAGDRQHALEYFRKAHDGASARGQAQLLASIDRDLKRLAGE